MFLCRRAPSSQPNRSETKTVLTCLHAFSYAWHRLHEFDSNWDWFHCVLTIFIAKS